MARMVESEGRAQRKATAVAIGAKRRKSGIPTGHAGEYLVMGELLRRGFDAQLADRNTKGYDLLVGRPGESTLRKVQVKTVRATPWYVKLSAFTGPGLKMTTVYVLLGREDARHSVRYFIVKNQKVGTHVSRPPGWQLNGFMFLKTVERYEDRWDTLTTRKRYRTPRA